MSSIVRSAGIVAGSTMLSRILGFTRDMLMAAFFGASGKTDVFFIAFRIPNLFRRFFGEGALTISFIPVYTEYLVQKGEKEALAVAQRTLSFLVVMLIAIVALGEVFSPEIVSFMAQGKNNPGDLQLASELTRIMFPYLFFVCLVAFCMGVLNSHKYFFAPAFSAVLFNASMIVGILVLTRYFSEPLYGVAIGVVCGGIIQVILQIPYMIKTGFKVKIIFDWKHPGIKKIVKMLLPALFGLAVYQINIVINLILASFLADGSISYLFYSERLTELVQGVFIVSIGNVILPEMSQMTTLKDFSRLKELYVTSIRSALFIAIPAAAALMAIGLPIIAVVFMRGEFDFYDALMTNRALFYGAMGICSVAMLRLTTPTFFSFQDSRTPMIAATINTVINVILGYTLMQTSLQHAGLNLALTVSCTVQLLILIFFLRKKIGHLGLNKLIMPVAKNILAAGMMVLAIVAIGGQVDWLEDAALKKILFLITMVVAGGAVYGLVSVVLDVDEAQYIIKRLRRK